MFATSVPQCKQIDDCVLKPHALLECQVTCECNIMCHFLFIVVC